MKELIDSLTKSLGISGAQAEGGAAVLLKAAKDKLGAAERDAGEEPEIRVGGREDHREHDGERDGAERELRCDGCVHGILRGRKLPHPTSRRPVPRSAARARS